MSKRKGIWAAPCGGDGKSRTSTCSFCISAFTEGSYDFEADISIRAMVPDGLTRETTAGTGI
jgi:hypothetical protein